MVWVKRNLGLVIGGAIAFALMLFAGYYLWTKYQEDQAISAELQAATDRYNELLQRPVHPGNNQVNNIERAKTEKQKLEELLAAIRAKIGTNEVPKNMGNKDFRALLDNTVTELQRQAEKLGITLPAKDYWFTFAPHKNAVEFKSLEMLTHQLMDVKSLCDVMYQAKIHDLVGLRRVAASSDDNNSTDFLGDKKPSTNDFAIVTPYEISFQGFTPELARVLEGLISSKQCFVVRAVGVEKASTDPNAALQMQAQMPMMPFFPGMNPALSMRYRMPMPAPPPQPTTPTGAPRRPGGVLLDENKLKFVLKVDAVRLKPPGEKKLAQATVEEPAAEPAPQ